MGADRDKDGVEIAFPLLSQQIIDPMVENDLDAHVLNALDLGVQHIARQPVGGNAEMHHAASHRSGFVDFDFMAQAGQVIGGGQPAGASANN